MTHPLLGEWFEKHMEMAFVSDVFAFDAWEESHECYLESELDAENVIWRGDDGYEIMTVPDDDAPTVLLFQKDAVVGLYRDMMLWIDAQHRGKGLGSELVVQFWEHFGEEAFDRNTAPLGFTEAGYQTHMKARSLVEERQIAPAL